MLKTPKSHHSQLNPDVFGTLSLFFRDEMLMFLNSVKAFLNVMDVFCNSDKLNGSESRDTDNRRDVRLLNESIERSYRFNDLQNCINIKHYNYNNWEFVCLNSLISNPVWLKEENIFKLNSLFIVKVYLWSKFKKQSVGFWVVFICMSDIINCNSDAQYIIYIFFTL